MKAKNGELHRALGRHVRELRSNKGFSQESFADHCGLHRTYMGAIERGERNVTLETLLTVASGLDMTVSELLANLENATSKVA